MTTIFKDQEPMTLEERHSLINKNLVDLVYNAAYLEGVRTSFVEARAFILEDLRLREEDMLEEPTDLNTLCELNRIVNGRGVSTEPGRVRSVVVTISGTDYVPEIPDPYTVNNTIRDIVEEKKTFIERGLDLYCYLMRTQVFLDGNKRSANLLCNQFLLRHGQGIFSIRPERNDEFLKKLVAYYESGDPTDLKIYLYENCFYTDPSHPYIDD